VTTYSNFAHTLPLPPAALFKPRDENEILRILAEYSSAKIRVLGSGHSWNDFWKHADILMDLGELSRVSISPDENHVTVEAGCTITSLLRALNARGLTLPTMGTITRQTIAGAISTATHGSGPSSLSHYIQSVRIAAYDGQGQPCVYTIDAGDDLRAVRCGLGLTGIILSVTLTCIRSYNISETLGVVDSLEDVSGVADQYPLQFFAVVPYCWKFYVARRRRDDSPHAWRLHTWLPRLWFRFYKKVVQDWGLHFFVKHVLSRPHRERITTLFYKLLPVILRKGTVTDTDVRILTMRHDLFRHVEMEPFVPARHLAAALELMKHLIEVFAGRCKVDDLPAGIRDELERVPGAVADLREGAGSYVYHYVIVSRRVEPDDTLISMTADALQDYYTLSVFDYRPGNADFAAFCRLTARCLVNLYEARLHWGKYTPLEPEVLARTLDGQRLATFREVRARLDPRAVFRGPFADALLRPPGES